MTSVLVITNKSDLTSDYIIKELSRRGVDFYRLNTEELSQTVKIDLDFESQIFKIIDYKTERSIDVLRITAVYYRRPEIPNLNGLELSNGERLFLENEYIYTLEGLYRLLKDAFWINSVHSIREAENKIYQLQLAKRLGFNIPRSKVSSDYRSLRDFYEKNSQNCIVKPIKSGFIQGNDTNKESLIFTNRVEGFQALSSNEVDFFPHYFQENLEKKFDIRATVVGDEIFATTIDSQMRKDAQIDWRRDSHGLKHEKISLPSSLEEKCRNLLRALRLRFGAIDFVLDKDEDYFFLEINPNGQWAWIERLTGHPISQRLTDLLCHELE